MSDYPQAYRELTRKARKQYKCFECYNAIQVGEKYQYVSGVWDGKPDSFKTCLSCSDLREFYRGETGEDYLVFGMLRDYIYELLNEVGGYNEYPEYKDAFDKLLGANDD